MRWRFLRRTRAQSLRQVLRPQHSMGALGFMRSAGQASAGLSFAPEGSKACRRDGTDPSAGVARLHEFTTKGHSIGHKYAHVQTGVKGHPPAWSSFSLGPFAVLGKECRCPIGASSARKWMQKDADMCNRERESPRQDMGRPQVFWSQVRLMDQDLTRLKIKTLIAGT